MGGGYVCLSVSVSVCLSQTLNFKYINTLKKAGPGLPMTLGEPLCPYPAVEWQSLVFPGRSPGEGSPALNYSCWRLQADKQVHWGQSTPWRAPAPATSTVDTFRSPGRWCWPCLRCLLTSCWPQLVRAPPCTLPGRSLARDDPDTCGLTQPHAGLCWWGRAWGVAGRHLDTHCACLAEDLSGALASRWASLVPESLDNVCDVDET